MDRRGHPGSVDPLLLRLLSALGRAARVLTEAGAPAVVLGVLPVVISVATAPTPAAGLVWGLVAALFFAVLPFGYVVRSVRAGRVTDRHVGRREQRTRIFAVSLAIMLAGFAVLAAAHAPRTLLAFLAGVFIEALLALIVSRFWKISIHSWVAAAGATSLVIVLGRWALIAWPFMAGVGWSRIRLRDHTVAQVAAGTLAGLLSTVLLLPLLR